MEFTGPLDHGEVHRTDQVHDFASGKATNVARVLATLKRPVRLVTLVGGERGQAFVKGITALPIELHRVDTDAETRLCVSAVDRTRGEATEFVQEPEALPADTADRLLATFVEALQDARVAVFSGKIATGLRETLYQECVEAARERDVPTIVDGRRGALEAALKARPTVVKPNRRELANTVGRPVDSRAALRDAMHELSKRGAEHIVCTRGRFGASLCGCGTGDDRFWEVSTPQVKSVSAVGSGDAFAAGLAAGMSDGASVREASRFASACGAANTLSPHAAHIDPAKAQELLRDVEVRQV